MRKKGIIAIILVLLTAFAFPSQAFATTENFLGRKEGLNLAPVGYNEDMFEEYFDDFDAFIEYIKKEAIATNESINIAEYNIPVIEEVYRAIAYYVLEEVPELFHIGTVGFTAKNNVLYTVTVTYTYSKEDYAKMFAECEAVAEEMLADIKEAETLTEAEKALLVHDRLALICNYDKDLSNKNKFGIYGALVDGDAVCEGYSNAYRYLLEKIGIKSTICSSEKLIHAWNIVYIDGVPYHVDVTWDDIIGLAGEVYHDNFLRSTQALYEGGSELFENGHVADDYDTTPQDTRYDNAFWKRSYSAFQLLDGELYYVDSTRCTINKYSNGESEELYKCRAVWNKYWNMYMRLSTDGEILFYSTNREVYTFDPETLISTSVYQPEEVEQGLEIYGFEYRNKYLICDLYSTNNYFNADVIRVDKLYERGHSGEDLPSNPVPQHIKLISSFSTIYCPVGSELKTEGLQLEVTYTNGAQKTIKDGFTVSGFDSSSPGTKTVYITWEGIVTHFEIHVYSPGDANNDGKISVVDATTVQKYLAGLIDLTDVKKAASDVTSDNKLSISDATRIQKYIAGLVDNIVK